ncbi:MAG: two-component regulator propeller domain-containing protein [Prolixibacteraceae bacterium]
MKFIKLLNLTLFCYLGILINTYAFKIEKLGIEQGLSNNNVISITQDKEGFIWFATKDGLNRFDANSFTIFKKSESNENSICSNVLNRVYADQFDDVVWIATEKNGIDAYNYKTQIFTHYEHDYSGQEKNSLGANGITHITGDGKGNLWLATYLAGIDFFNKKTGQFTHFNQSNIKGLVSNYNWYVMPDSENRIYVGHVTDGFSIIDLSTKTAVNFKHQEGDPNSLPDNTVTCIFKDSGNRIWVGTRDGLTLFDPMTLSMINFKHDPENPNSISYNFIESIIETKDSELWIGTEGGGVNVVDMNELSGNIDPQNIHFEHIHEDVTSDGLSSASVQSMIQDSYGNIWVGGYGGGINFIPKKEPFFKTINYLPLIGNANSLNSKTVPGLCVDKENDIWCANSSGGISIYRKDQKMKQISTINNDPKPLNISCVFRDHDDNIWIGDYDGRIYQYNQQSKSYHLLTSFENLKNIPIYNFFEDSGQNLWFSTDIGLYVYNIATKKTNVYTTSNSGLMDNNVRAVAEDGNGNIWVGALGGGLCVYDKNFNMIYDLGKSYTFYSISSIYKDTRNRMWVGSQNDLFLFKDYTKDAVIRIGKSSGLAETFVRAIVEGKSADEIWLSTTNGICNIDLNTMHISNFDVSNNIALGDYLNGSVAKTNDGRIYFGSQNGITWFNQVLEQSSLPNPKVAFTNFAVTSNKNYLNQFTDIPFVDQMKLNHNQNSFQISFNVLDYSLADKVEFVYQMAGLDDGWYLVNTGNEVTFRNLKPGNYVFNIKSRIQNNDWSDQITSMVINIKPPFWLNWWMKFIYITIIIIVFLYVLRFYTNNLKIENDLLLEKKSRQQEHELNEEKIKFFTNITHELRTPMTLILGPLEDLISDAAIPPEQSKKINSIHRVANRLLHLINQILEFRKSSNKNRKLRVLKDDFVKYVYDTGLKYKELNHNKNVEFRIDVPEMKIEMFFDPEVVTIILDNLLSNAFKYTQEGVIKLKLRNYVDGNIDYTEIIVADTGFGISEDNLPHIFERFYQAKNASYPVTGTGIGLALVNNLVELHEAEISVNSQLNKGTTFKVKFITNNSYPEVIHINPGEVQSEVSETGENSKNVILVVDDNQEIVEYIRDCLMDTYIIITAENGKVGYEIACDKVPDLVISDVMMPVMDGIEMCKVMKKDVRTSHIPVVLLTAKVSLQDQSEGYDAGADSYLTKPFSGNLLKSRLRNILEARKKLSTEFSSKFKDRQLLFNESISQLDKEFLKKLTAVIESNLEDEEMNISQVASQLNMSHSTLYRKIKALTNLTANEYIRKVRIKVAEQLLLTNQYTISEIMYRIGINSSSYFRQCFKDEFGMNPSEYLNKLKED